jgi:hypothetical protein
MNETYFTGVLGDPREDDRVKNGWSIDEVLASSAAFEWKEKKDRVRYPVWNQHQTGACVAFAKAKQISIRIFNMTGVWIDISPSSIYQLRTNQGEGMWPQEANHIVATRGATLEALMKSRGMTEQEINAVKRTKVADLFARALAEAVVSYLYVPVDADRIAQTIHSGRAVSLLVFGTFAEYARREPVIQVPNLTYENAQVRHKIIAVDYEKGKGVKKILCEDSSHFGGLAERDLTEDFLIKRCILADAIDVFTFDPGGGENPRYDGSIVSMQRCFRYEGLFPEDVDFVENLGPLTLKALRAFQVKHKLHPTGVNNVGPLTVQKLQELYP